MSSGFIDIHCHVLPGLDDGPETMEESLRMCWLAHEHGTDVIVATPHVNPGVFDNDWNTIQEGYRQLNEVLKKEDIPVTLCMGADVRLSESLMHKTDPSDFITINQNNKYMLLEFPDSLIPPNTDRFLFELQLKGITPIITHPERNYEIQRNPNLLQHYVRMGVIVQLTAMSFTGGFGEDLKDLSELMLAHNLVHVVASDAHSVDHRPPILSECYAHISRIAGEKMADALFKTTPQAILQGAEIYPEEPEDITSRHFNVFKRGLRTVKRMFGFRNINEREQKE